jgi:hypothetical protein
MRLVRPAQKLPVSSKWADSYFCLYPSQGIWAGRTCEAEPARRDVGLPLAHDDVRALVVLVLRLAQVADDVAELERLVRRHSDHTRPHRLPAPPTQTAT